MGTRSSLLRQQALGGAAEPTTTIAIAVAATAATLVALAVAKTTAAAAAAAAISIRWAAKMVLEVVWKPR